MWRKYALEWLDALITISLDPEKATLKPLTEGHVHTVISKIAEEKEKVQAFLKNQVFSLTKESQVSLLIRQYHAALILLLDQAFKHSKAMQPDNAALKPIYDTVISSLDELLSFIEVRFSAHMSLDERVPVTYLSVTKKELEQRVDQLKPGLLNQVKDKQIAGIVLDSLYTFIHRSKEEGHPIAFRELLYQKDLLKELEALERAEGIDGDKALYELLIYKNFNSKAYIHYLTQKLTLEINACENIAHRLDRLLFHYKELQQIYRRREATLNQHHCDLKTALSNWFTQEIAYLEKKLQLAIVSPEGNARQQASQAAPSDAKPQKLLCNLSVDQMAIVLRAADDLKLVTVRSLNHLFKTIAPYLSTLYQENISYSSMRSKSYTAETRDKEIVIELLQKMVRTIREY